MSGKIGLYIWKKGYKLGTLALALLLSLGVASAGTWSVQASGSAGSSAGATGVQMVSSPQLTCPGGQCFADVTPANPFYGNINNLYMDGIIGGFACGGEGEPCDSANRPYYRPGNNVTRQQMTKFIDLGRRSIADATGLSLALNGPLSVNGTTTLSDTLGASLFISSTFTASGHRYGVITGINNARGTSFNAGVYGEGATAVWGQAISTGTSNGYAGYFYNVGGGSGYQAGVYASSPGYGVSGYSRGTTASQDSVGVFGQSSTTNGYGGVFSGTASSGVGVSGKGITTGGSAGVGAVAEGRAGLLATGGSQIPLDANAGYNPAVVANGGDDLIAVDAVKPTSVSGGAYSFYGVSRVHGSNVTAASYSVEMVYHGSAPLDAGDIVALDGNNETINDREVLGVVKADSGNASLAAGVVELKVNKNMTGTDSDAPFDYDLAHAKSGDLLQVAIAGQTKVKVSGPVKLGDRLAIGDKGLAATRDIAESIGKVAGLPDKDGGVTVLINFK